MSRKRDELLIKTASMHEFGQPKISMYWRSKYSLFSQHMNSIRNEIRVYGTDI